MLGNSIVSKFDGPKEVENLRSQCLLLILFSVNCLV